METTYYLLLFITILFIGSFTYYLVRISIKYNYRRLKHTEAALNNEIKKNLNLDTSIQKLILELEEQKKQQENQQGILNQIINCASQSIKGRDEFDRSMKELASKLRSVFKSEYCSIGTVLDSIVQDRVIDFEKHEQKDLLDLQFLHLKKVKYANTSDKNCMVCKALRKSDNLTRVFGSHINRTSDFYKSYMFILKSKRVIDTTIIPIRENNINYGFIQFINSKETIKYHHIRPFMKAFIGLTQSIIEREKNQIEQTKRLRELRLAENRAKDAKKFYYDIKVNNDNVDSLLKDIMEYLSIEFNAAIISFRIPILSEEKQSPLFYLRSCFVHQSIPRHEALKNYYLNNRSVKSKNQIGGYERLKCCNKGKIIEDMAKDSDYYQEFDLSIQDSTLIMPILRDFDEAHICYNSHTSKFCGLEENPECIDRFKKLYGFFRLRLFKNNSSDSDLYEQDFEEIKSRLQYLSRQITLLLNSIDDKHENESLQTFQNQLRNSSFIKIKEFDERCVEIIKESVDATICSIYRYDKGSNRLTLSASTAKNTIVDGITKDSNNYSIQMDSSYGGFTEIKYFSNAVRPKYVLDLSDPNNCFFSLFRDYNNHGIDKNNRSAMILPIRKKNKTFEGIVVLLGKEKNIHSISNVYWEHDIKHVEFIVNVLLRISESDTERLTFLAQLSHELLAPVTEVVYDNQFIIEKSKKDKDAFTKSMLLSLVEKNLGNNLLFKYIIDDAKYIYSSSKKNITFKISEQKKSQEILMNAVRLLEKDAHAKSIEIIPNISDMPTLFFNKEAMMQVYINLLKNAIRYAHDFSSIEIFYKFDKSHDFHEIRFANFGVGISEEEKDSIFDLYYRGKNAEKKVLRGSGMGLFIVREIMRAHGGDCIVRSLNSPTEFVILLPNTQSN